jgi:hypothetical protein
LDEGGTIVGLEVISYLYFISPLSRETVNKLDFSLTGGMKVKLGKSVTPAGNKPTEVRGQAVLILPFWA